MPYIDQQEASCTTTTYSDKLGGKNGGRVVLEGLLTDPPLVHFESPALALVICQLRFSPVPLFRESTLIDSFYRTIQETYPQSARTAQVVFPFIADQSSGELPTNLFWKFSSLDGRWTLVLSENALTLETREYKSFEEFVTRFENAVQALIKTLNPALETRLGLRYINEFQMSDAIGLQGWARYIRPEILGLTGTIHELFQQAEVVFSRQELELRLSDGSLILRHGLHSGTTVEPAEIVAQNPNPSPSGPFYLLDMDRSESSPQQIEPSEISARLAQFNREIYRFFRWSMLPDLFEVLGPKDGR